MVNIMNNNWNPFFALANTRNKIDEAFERKYDVEQPDICEDKLYEIQEKVVSSYEECSIIEIKYFKNKRYHIEIGIVSKLDVFSKTITINNNILKFENIIEVL